jgi:hypothetical protein
MQVSKWLGHESYVTTLTIYADYIDETEGGKAAPLARPVAPAPARTGTSCRSGAVRPARAAAPRPRAPARHSDGDRGSRASTARSTARTARSAAPGSIIRAHHAASSGEHSSVASANAQTSRRSAALRRSVCVARLTTATAAGRPSARAACGAGRAGIACGAS